MGTDIPAIFPYVCMCELGEGDEYNKLCFRSEMDRLVEDLIQESMQRGEFDNLAGKGKPLKHQASNPYVDFVTYKMNQVQCTLFYGITSIKSMESMECMYEKV